MPDKASKKAHIPIRSCVVCKKKFAKNRLNRFIIKEGKIIMDASQTSQARGYYCCSACLDKLEKWMEKRKR
ncbi:MAG: DUF448 domain-containing protein [Candidatus Cloacimonadia bacterium]